MAQTITIDLTPDGRRIFQRPYLFFSQGDIGQEFVINLKSRFGNDIPAGATVKIEATKPSGLGFSEQGALSDQTVTFTVTEIMTDEAGHFPVELTLSAADEILGTANFNFLVEADPHPEGTIDGQAEEVIPVLTQLVERVEDAADSIHELTVEATTLEPNTPATATYDEDENEITFGIPRGAQLMASDDGNGIITLTFS